jgi:hypothetical protein
MFEVFRITLPVGEGITLPPIEITVELIQTVRRLNCYGKGGRVTNICSLKLLVKSCIIKVQKEKEVKNKSHKNKKGVKK